MTINMACGVYISTINPLMGMGLIMMNTAVWFSTIAWMKGFNSANKIIDSRIDAFKRVLDRYKKGEIKTINEQVIEQEFMLNKYYK